MNEDSKSKDRVGYTNADLLELLDPLRDELPYVWDHWEAGVCESPDGSLPTLD